MTISWKKGIRKTFDKKFAQIEVLFTRKMIDTPKSINSSEQSEKDHKMAIKNSEKNVAQKLFLKMEATGIFCGDRLLRSCIGESISLTYFSLK